MPRVPVMPPADRFFARLDRFECECPSCGRLIFTSLDKHSLPMRLQERAHLRRDAATTPRSKRVWKSVWNPHSQRLACPWCHRSFVGGLMLYPVRPYVPRPVNAPPDTVPNDHERAEMIERRKAGGWRSRRYQQAGQHVNLAVTSPCSCGEGWTMTCPIHGDPDR
jgi:hypothetical protein